MLVNLTITIILLKYTCSNAQGVPYNGTCTFTHDCADWRDGRVICDMTKRCTCRPVLTDTNGKVFWNSTSRRCVYCPARWFFQGTRCYYFPNEKASWSNARDRCRYPFMADKHGEEMSVSMIFPDTWDSPYYTRFWIGAMNEPYVKFGEFSWIDNRGFRFDQNSSMWCRPNINGVPAVEDPQPSWSNNNTNETRIALIRWRSLRYNNQSVFCLNDEQSDKLSAFACERTSTSFKTRCDTSNNTCQNEGICTAVTEREPIQCDCTETPYGGTYCTDNCGSLPSHCHNGGNCTKLGYCECTSLWEGPLCTEAKNPCLSHPCQHNGQCIQLGNTPSFMCNCGDSGWIGEFCHITKYPCPADRCMNNGQCKAVGRDNFTCNCIKTGYQGTFCEQGCYNTDKPCQNSGSCIDNQCLCNPLTTGDFCEIIDNSNSANSQIQKETSALKIWLIIGLCIVSIIIIFGLIYSRKKLFKTREHRRNSIDNEYNYKSHEKKNNENTDNDSVSTALSQASQNTKYIQE
ncbi:unnamed protein product [Rotaria sp. Silwood1]|nr:unnamed protein product [Rotaria sp. Silwood1]